MSIIHPSCQRIESAVPIRDCRVVGPPGRFSGSLVRYQDRWVMATRDEAWPRTLQMHFLSEDLEVEHSWPVVPKADWCEDGCEDPRLIHHDGKLLMSFTGLYRLNSAIVGKQCLAGWNEDFSKMWAGPVVYANANIWEKNWQFFSRQGQLFCVYCPKPHRVNRVHLTHSHTFLGFGCEATNNDRANLPQYARGGAPPVLLNGEWYHWYHTTQPYTGRWKYCVGLYTFEDAPPFNIKRTIPQLVFQPTIGPEYKDTLMVMGAVAWKDSWILTIGLDDKETIAMTISQAEIERLLIRVPEIKTLKSWGNDGVLRPTSVGSPVVEIQTSLGPLKTREPKLDGDMAEEIGQRDSYRLKELVNVFKPATIWDLGAAVGQVSLLCHRLWPDAKIMAVEAEEGRYQCLRANLPPDWTWQLRVGEDFRAGPAVRADGAPDLLVTDCEGGEVPFFWQVEECCIADQFKVICGEWHLWGGRALLAQVLRDTHHVFFSDPNNGAGPWHYFWAVRKDLPNELFQWAAGGA